ncbi:hypothetical protein H4S07_000649 [Coemansia furcata]|uniref:Uncharacterized protein n=1 Tax=Coemansia furcata TaxID=417177 RepID=A0ACC1LQQ5_9FUNG|nr:hypothetical protein H4S07_000649 [Coemansia furcata]
MPHINDLPAAVLTQILYKATAFSAKTLSEWKANLPLVAVCRAWTELAQPFVFYHVYVELASSPWSEILPFAYSNTYPFWTSNAELIISRGCVLMARRLTIELADILTPECLQSIALEILKLDCVDWQHINALTITDGSSLYPYYDYTTDIEEASEADIARTVQYFRQNVRNVIEFNFAHTHGEAEGSCLAACLVAIYGRQLQIHRALSFIPVSILNFSRNIKVLELNLGTLATSILTGICSATLGVLRLYDAPRNFAWHYFRYDTFVQPIVFRKLTVLNLSYQSKDEGKALTEAEIQEKVALGALNCDQLCFPALRELWISNCTPDCDLLYADIPFPELKTVVLSGSIDSISHCTRLKLTWVQHLSVTITPSSSDNSTDIYGAANHYFSNVCIGRTATLAVLAEWLISDPDQMRWINLTILFFLKVDYTTICKVVGQLPNLCELAMFFLEFGDMATDSRFADSPLFISADPLLAWAEKLETVIISSFSKDSILAVGISGIQEFILHAGALKNLHIPISTRRPVTAYIDMYKDRYPHLADIKFLDE